MDNAAIAIVIPVLDDSDALRVLARRIRGWKTQPTEVVVVSVKPEPELRSLCSEYEYIYIESVANRGLQLDQGARATRGEVLWFLHADAEPPSRMQSRTVPRAGTFDSSLPAGRFGGSACCSN